ncbi:MAG: DMT family transporter [SAR324 cluster bacterium]|nr:DMT family transporter [SAR324 cluster bacterium]
MILTALRASKSKRGLAFMGLALIGGGCFSLPYQHALHTVEPLTAVYGVFVWALLFSMPGAWALRRNTRFSPKVVLLLIAISLSGVLGNFAVCTALQGGSPTLVIIVSRVEIVLALLLGWGLLREAVAPKVWMAVGIILLGITFMRHDSLSIADGSGRFVLWAMVSALSFAMMQVLSKLIIDCIDPQALNVCRLVIALALMSAFPGMLEQVQAVPVAAWGWLGLAAFFGPFLGRVAYTYALRDLTIAKAMTIGTFAPVLTLLLEFVLFGRMLRWFELAGGALVMAGILLSFLRFSYFRRSF